MYAHLLSPFTIFSPPCSSFFLCISGERSPFCIPHIKLKAKHQSFSMFLAPEVWVFLICFWQYVTSLIKMITESSCAAYCAHEKWHNYWGRAWVCSLITTSLPFADDVLLFPQQSVAFRIYWLHRRIIVKFGHDKRGVAGIPKALISGGHQVSDWDASRQARSQGLLGMSNWLETKENTHNMLEGLYTF